MLCNLAPAVAVLSLQLDDAAVLFLVPRLFLDRGLQVMGPALAALLSISLLHVVRNLGPVTSTELFDQKPEVIIFIRCPGAHKTLPSLGL